MKRNQTLTNSGFSQIVRCVRKNIWLVLIYGIVTLGIVVLQNIVNIELIREISQLLVTNECERVLQLTGIYVVACVGATLFKRLSAILRIRFTQYVMDDVEQEFIDTYASIRYRDYYFDTEKVLGQIRKNGLNGVGKWCEWVLDVIYVVTSFLLSVFYLSSINFYSVILCIIVTCVFMLLAHRDNVKLPTVVEKFNGYMKDIYAKQWEQISNHKIASFLNLDKVVKPYKMYTSKFMSDLRRMKQIYNRSILFSTYGTDVVVLSIIVSCTILFHKSNVGTEGILALVIGIPNVSNTLFSIPQLQNSYRTSISDINMLNEYYEMASLQTRTKAIKLQNVTEIDVQKISFHYNGKSKKVIDNFSLKLNQGVHLLKGNSGCGKSTLLRILAGELPIQNGAIVFNELQIKTDSVYDFSMLVEYMSQDPVIINGTIKENIILGEIMDTNRFNEAIDNADLGEFIKSLPDLENTKITTNKLSSGEKQKIAIARVFYQNKSIWLLDEPFSALDPAATNRVMKGLIKYATNRIIVLSSHQGFNIPTIKIHSWGIK